MLWVLDEVQLMGSGLGTTAQLAAFRQQLGVYGPAASLWVSATQEARWLETADHPAPTRVLSLSNQDYQHLGPRYWAEKPVSRAAETTRQAPALARAILDHHAPGTDSLAICNTVERAQGLYAALERGGNDGRLDFSNNFMQQLLHCLDPAADPGRRHNLEQALFGAAGGDLAYTAASLGQFLPGVWAAPTPAPALVLIQ